MALTDEPVLTGAVTTRRTPATIGYIHSDHVAEHVVIGSARRDVLTLTAEYDSQLDLPFDSVTAIRHHDVITAADDAPRVGLRNRYGTPDSPVAAGSSPPAAPGCSLHACV